MSTHDECDWIIEIIKEFIISSFIISMDWMAMSSVFVTSQSGCFFLCSREQVVRLVENRLYGRCAG
jgi:hypothetical protein